MAKLCISGGWREGKGPSKSLMTETEEPSRGTKSSRAGKERGPSLLNCNNKVHLFSNFKLK